MKHRVLISPADSKLINELTKYNIEAVFTAPVDNLIEYERFHADIQLLRLKDSFFIYNCVASKYSVLKDKELIVCEDPRPEYPFNVALNAAFLGDKLLCKESSLNKEVKKFCEKKGIKIINVNQGYTKCSTLVLNERAVITADRGIANTCEKNGVEALLISEGNIKLSGDAYGFIGGASGVIGDTVYFFGNVELHPEFMIISEFIKKQQMNYVSLSGEILTDLGGFVLLN